MSSAPSMDCAQLHSCSFLVTKRCVAGKAPNSSCGTSGKVCSTGLAPYRPIPHRHIRASDRP